VAVHSQSLIINNHLLFLFCDAMKYKIKPPYIIMQVF